MAGPLGSASAAQDAVRRCVELARPSGLCQAEPGPSQGRQVH
eukprot:CAMPEP_0119106936 /NCGR_PEP_ID=MMETSP1180-20130426/7592_1 /TAXON_ID=3052 ORGANISM="Chlamydomonas cf sp, Strain CCMP681" /NCGR_SAMPLE_ID=MMETSP1180 /ASSEMBLY_ACC=CAM_ASM_000741 /LENGTH=41 /DNA_ID= /DNA_START= /DNA_END= /DNA_ORIENTATION=